MSKIGSPAARKREFPRRKFLKTVALGGSASLLSIALGSRLAFGSGHADALLLSCIDYRLVDHTQRYMVEHGLKDKYDYVILAGASLGAITDKYPDWNKSFWDHLGLAIKLHSIHRVMIMDHRDCGAYQLILGEGCCDTREKETEAHRTQLKNLDRAIKKRYAELEVELLLMDLNGTVEKI
jgi:carbonic anhydrase